MTHITHPPSQTIGSVLVIGGTGKTGRRVAARLKDLGLHVKIGSRSASPSFDWNNEAGWDACLEGMDAAYITYTPDLAMPGATDRIAAFCRHAKQAGLKRLVLLSGRGEAEAQACEKIVQMSGLEWTVVRASWFFQNFSEGAFVDMVRAGEVTLPAGETPEPFIDAEDIADVAVAALTQEGHTGEIYDVTGPRLMTFSEVAAELSTTTGRDIRYVDVPHDAFIDGLSQSGAPQDVIWMLDYLFATVLDGRNANITDGVQRALGRPPRDFSAYAQSVVATSVWSAAA